MSRHVLAIDPGLRACGCALFDPEGVLVSAALVKNSALKLRGPQAHVSMAVEVSKWLRTQQRGVDIQLVLEYPMVYPNHSNKRSEDPNDLLELAGVDAAIAAWLASTDTVSYFPSEWKGQVPATQCARQIISRLNKNECKRIESFDAFVLNMEARWRDGKQVSHKAHNTLDAVGVGLHFLHRF